MSAARVLVASLVGTTIEFFDFYIFATAAVLVFPHLFFPASDPASATLQSLATFALAFFARPVGSAIFGHFGDRIGRKSTLVAALLTMGVSTVCIGFLPTYASVGILAPILLAACRLGQGVGLGGEWGGAILLAIENAPPGRRAWYGMFPQLGSPLGFLSATGIFLLLTKNLSADQFIAYGWRVPFIASALLVFVGLYIRLRLAETPAFQRAINRHERVRLPVLTVFKTQLRALILGTFVATAMFMLFYLMTVFALSWGTSALGYARRDFLNLQMGAMLFFAASIPLSALIAERRGSRAVLMTVTAATFLFGLVFGPLFSSDAREGLWMFLILGMTLMGLTYGPLGTALAGLFPTAVRYSGTSLAFNFAGILGGSLAPYFATWLGMHYGIAYVGYYLSAGALLTWIALWRLGPEAMRGHAESLAVVP